MSRLLEQTEYGIEVELPEDFEANDDFWKLLLPMGSTTDFCDTNFTCWGFETEADAQEALNNIEVFIKDQGE